MNLDDLISHFDNESSQQKKVALCVYYLEEYEEAENVTQNIVKEEIRRSRSPINPSSVSTYFQRLDNEGWIKNTGDRNYRLTHTGKRQVETLLDDSALDNPRDEEDYFLFIEYIEKKDTHYKSLIDSINKSYRYRIYEGTMVLTRKFFEDITFQILKTYYAGKDNQMFYDQENSRHYSFEDLLNNLKEGVPALRQYSRELDQQLVENLRSLKNEGNSGAHAIRVNFSDEEIESWSNDVTEMANILYDVLRGARIRDEYEG